MGGPGMGSFMGGSVLVKGGNLLGFSVIANVERAAGGGAAFAF